MPPKTSGRQADSRTSRGRYVRELFSEPLTRFEENDGAQAAALGHVRRELSEAAEDVLDGAHVAAAADAEPGLGVGRVQQ